MCLTSASPSRAPSAGRSRSSSARGCVPSPREHRRVLVPGELDGLSHAEIAQLLGLEEGTVKPASPGPSGPAKISHCHRELFLRFFVYSLRTQSPSPCIPYSGKEGPPYAHL